MSPHLAATDAPRTPPRFAIFTHDTFGLGHADFDHLRRIIPLIDGGRQIEPFIALHELYPTVVKTGAGDADGID